MTYVARTLFCLAAGVVAGLLAIGLCVGAVASWLLKPLERYL
jgi:hypothetical protein